MNMGMSPFGPDEQEKKQRCEELLCEEMEILRSKLPEAEKLAALMKRHDELERVLHG